MKNNMIHITIPELAPGLNRLMRLHYHAYGKVRDRWTLMVRAGVDQPLKLDGVEAEIDRYYCRLPLDWDNLYASGKIPLDALCHAGVIVDDNPNALVSLKVRQHKVATEKEERTEITITLQDDEK